MDYTPSQGGMNFVTPLQKAATASGTVTGTASLRGIQVVTFDPARAIALRLGGAAFFATLPLADFIRAVRLISY